MNNPLEIVELLPGLQLPRGIAEFWDQIKNTRLPSIKIDASPVEDHSSRKSTFGCYPTIPKGFLYPRDTNGNFLFPLAQIYCNELPLLEGYPNSGYLQFYIAVEDNDVYGMDFDNQQSQADFRILYFEEDAVREPETDFNFLAETIHADYSPVQKPYVLTFSLQDDYLGAGEVRFNESEELIAHIKQKYPDLAKQFEDEIYRKFSYSGHKMGGYAYFTQTDPREYKKDVKDFLLLFQIDSDQDIMWGDVGVANFFIDRNDLLKKDFSKVFYNWDCC
jgi:uncharacterized protein YwqG